MLRMEEKSRVNRNIKKIRNDIKFGKLFLPKFSFYCIFLRGDCVFLDESPKILRAVTVAFDVLLSQKSVLFIIMKLLSFEQLKKFAHSLML